MGKYILKNKMTGRYLVYDFDMRSNSLKFAGYDIKDIKYASVFDEEELDDLENEFYLFQKHREFSGNYNIIDYNIELRGLKLKRLNRC